MWVDICVHMSTRSIVNSAIIPCCWCLLQPVSYAFNERAFDCTTGLESAAYSGPGKAVDPILLARSISQHIKPEWVR